MSLSPLTPATFCNPLDAAISTVATAYSAGGTSLTVASGAAFPGPYPVRLTCFRGSDPTMLATYTRTHLKITAVSGNVLTVAPIDGYAGLALQVGDLCHVAVSKGTIGDIHAAIATTQTLVNQVVTVANEAVPIDSPAFTGPTSLASAATTFDSGGFGLPREFTFLLAQGTNLANGAALALPGAIAGYAGKYTKWKALAGTNPSGGGGGFTLDITRNGTSIFGSPPSVAANTTTVQAGSVSGTFAEGDVFNITITSAGTGVQDVRVVLYGLERNT